MTCSCSFLVLNNHLASMYSRPLFIIVAESIDILGPIDQLGCLIAALGVIRLNSLNDLVKKGPPDPVNKILDTPFSVKSQ